MGRCEREPGLVGVEKGTWVGGRGLVFDMALSCGWKSVYIYFYCIILCMIWNLTSHELKISNTAKVSHAKRYDRDFSSFSNVLRAELHNQCSVTPTSLHSGTHAEYDRLVTEIYTLKQPC